MHIRCETKVFLPLPFFVIGIKHDFFESFNLSKSFKQTKGQDFPIPLSFFVLGYIFCDYCLLPMSENNCLLVNQNDVQNLKSMLIST